MDDAKKQEQVRKFEELQDLILDDLLEAARNKELSATDRATILRFLEHNGWTVDPSKIPTTLRDMLTKRVRFDEGVEGDAKLKLAK